MLRLARCTITERVCLSYGARIFTRVENLSNYMESVAIEATRSETREKLSSFLSKLKALRNKLVHIYTIIVIVSPLKVKREKPNTSCLVR